MAVSSEVSRVVHTANGTATFFSYAPIDGVTSDNLKVYLFNPTTGVLTLQTLGTNYTFGNGGVTFNTAPPSGWRVILRRLVELLQPDIYKTNAPFPAVVTEKRLDEIVKGLQQLSDIAQSRAIILPLGDAGFSTNVLPAVENRKGRVLYFNATTGDPEAKQLADTIVAVSPWAMSFLTQSTAAAGLSSIGAVAKAGDTMAGNLVISKPVPVLQLDSHPLTFRTLRFSTNYLSRWELLTDSDAESGGNVGSTLRLRRFDDTGASFSDVFSVERNTGRLLFEGSVLPRVPAIDPTDSNDIVRKEYADRSGPGGLTGLIFTTSGTTYDITGIPSWANVIEVLMRDISTAAGVRLRIRLGTSSGFVTSGYSSASGSRFGEITDNTCFILFVVDPGKTNGIIRMVHAGNNRWIQTHVGSESYGAFSGGGGSINLGDTLTQLRLYVTSSNFTGGLFSVRFTA